MRAFDCLIREAITPVGTHDECFVVRNSQAIIGDVEKSQSKDLRNIHLQHNVYASEPVTPLRSRRLGRQDLCLSLQGTSAVNKLNEGKEKRYIELIFRESPFEVIHRMFAVMLKHHTTVLQVLCIL